ncbi:MAG: MFS transporter [Steroidobacteraceae bacterium]
MTGSTRWRMHLGWAIGTLGASLVLNSFSFLALYYLTTVVGMAAALAGTVILLGKIWDVIFNPLMGVISDRIRTPMGRRRPYLLLGALVSGVAVALLFTLGVAPWRDSIAATALIILLIGTGYTIFNVPYMAMPAEMVDNYNERSAMMSWRVFFIGIGTLAGGAAGKKLVEMFGGGEQGFATLGVLLGCAVAFFMGLTFFATRKASFTERGALRIGFVEQLRMLAGNRPFMALLGVKLTQLFGLATNTAVALFIIQFVMHRPNVGTWLLYYGLASTAVQIISIPFWLRTSVRFEKRNTYLVATVIFALASLSWLLASPAEPLWFFLLRAVVKGFSAAGLLLMGQSMLPDTIEFDFRRTGLRREGVFSGLYSIVEKFAFAIAPAILGWVLSYYGFVSKAPQQSALAVDGIRYAAALLPALYFGLSIPFLLSYGLDESKLKGTGAGRA